MAGGGRGFGFDGGVADAVFYGFFFSSAIIVSIFETSVITACTVRAFSVVDSGQTCRWCMESTPPTDESAFESGHVDRFGNGVDRHTGAFYKQASC